MSQLRVWFPLGGGVGDCAFDFLHEPEFQKLASLVEDHDARVRCVSQCHCDAVEDLFKNHPHVHEHLTEPWHPPTPEDGNRFNNVEDGYIPISRTDLLRHAGVHQLRMQPTQLYLSDEEKAQLGWYSSVRPLIAIQPYAGLSDRDGFDPPAIGRLCEALLQLQPNCRIVILGKNHERGHKYSREECFFEHPNVLNRIDQIGIRLACYLVSICDAFCGAHSNLIRIAWDTRRRSACVMPDPLMTRHLEKLDKKYTYGFGQPESRIYTYPFDHGQERRFDLINIEALAAFLLRG